VLRILRREGGGRFRGRHQETQPDLESDLAELSEDDIREYTRRLRSLPVEQVIGEAMFALLNAARAKIGRRDARLLIDVVTVSRTHAGGHLSAELATRMDGLLGQLRLAQVSAEGRAGQPGRAKEKNDLDRAPTPPAATQATPPTAPPTAGSTRTSGLWVPGG
jgi:hypothetical protein